MQHAAVMSAASRGSGRLATPWRFRADCCAIATRGGAKGFGFLACSVLRAVPPLLLLLLACGSCGHWAC